MGVSLDKITEYWKSLSEEERECARMSAFGNFEFVTNIRGERVMVRKSNQAETPFLSYPCDRLTTIRKENYGLSD